ncbi:SMP-30/gluconolactonase/LRE family protein [Alloalcanivorax xenomutans]|uniref:SMP-30/gluconolactonase/LRE family protein n=1 Tax=Alloalcanivorax xenomutans TaxID=1094342 RepID=UPI003BA9D382
MYCRPRTQWRWMTLALCLSFGAAVQAEEARYDAPRAVVGPLPYLGVHGLGVDAEGRLYAGSVVGQSLNRVDINSGKVTVFEGPDEGMADDVAFGPDGEMAWTSYLSGILRIRDADGEVRDAALGLPGINSLAYNQEGRLFATQVFMGDALYEIDRQGEAPVRKIKEDMGGLNGFEFGADGKLYGPLWFKGKVVRVDVDSGKMETVARDFQVPAAVNFDAEGRLYVVDTKTGELVRVDVDSGAKTTVATLQPALDNLAVDHKRKRIYVSNMADNSIQEVDPESGQIRTLVRSDLAAPAGLSVVGDDIYIADVFALRRYAVGEGKVHELARVWGSDLEYPMNIWADQDTVVTASWAAGVVQEFDRHSGELKRSLHEFKAPHDVVRLNDGSLLVAELASGDLVRVSGEEGKKRDVVVEDLEGPAGLSLNKDGSALYVADAGGNLWAFDTDDWSRRLIRDDLVLPEGIDLTRDGKLLVMEVGKRRLLEVDPVRGDQRVLAEELPVGLPQLQGLPPTGVFNDVVEAANGDLYFSADRKGGLYRMKRR